MTEHTDHEKKENVPLWCLRCPEAAHEYHRCPPRYASAYTTHNTRISVQDIGPWKIITQPQRELATFAEYLSHPQIYAKAYMLKQKEKEIHYTYKEGERAFPRKVIIFTTLHGISARLKILFLVEESRHGVARAPRGKFRMTAAIIHRPPWNAILGSIGGHPISKGRRGWREKKNSKRSRLKTSFVLILFRDKN
ncbi:hypothetical protein CDAR_378991 [Caerostris darwini]|uniref:Uncharacterized protein n=1 Tax=Caerostris darwini TaxID=1538125 RepID=A0AAV4TWA7_9ARAC|nr:hypothetical protein CDAR_378991 [Caerostris darwini]